MENTSIMNLDKSLFVSDEVYEKKVKLSDGEEHSLFFKELSSSQYRKFYYFETSEDEDKRAQSQAYLISCSMCDERGKPVITIDQACKLKVDALQAISNAIKEVNKLKDPAEVKKP
jgi:hypothetical protein